MLPVLAGHAAASRGAPGALAVAAAHLHAAIKHLATPSAASASASAAAPVRQQQPRSSSDSSSQAIFFSGQTRPAPVNWVFLGPPGVGKGTYASRASKAFGVPHIATGDLIRAEIKAGTALGQQMKAIVNQGKLLPDDMILQVLQHRLERGQQEGEQGFILDGFPRTRHQAEELLKFASIGLALNMGLREDVLVEKCMGRRLCKHCGSNYNVADIRLPARPADGLPEIVMPPLTPKPECVGHLETRPDDTEAVIRHRLEVYKREAAPVEEYLRQAGLLVDFQITAGIPETLPGLLTLLRRYAQ